MCLITNPYTIYYTDGERKLVFIWEIPNLECVFLQRCHSSCTINSEKESFQKVVAKR
jgi:hypothetical protein